MSALVDSTVASQLVLTLGHFLWQGLVLGGLAWIAGFTLRRRSTAPARYRLYAGALLLMAICPVATFLVNVDGGEPSASRRIRGGVANSDRSEAKGDENAQAAPNAHPVQDRLAEHVNAESPPPLPEGSGAADLARESTGASPAGEQFDWRRFAPLLAGLYLSGVLLMLVRLGLGLRGGRRLRRSAEPVGDGAILDLLASRAAALGLRFVPALAWCRGVAVPTVVGVIRPTILLPLTLCSGLTADQIGAILAHELAHVRRWDPLVNVAQRVIEAALFFHPMVWLVSRGLRRERERCCDDLVIGLGIDRFEYASSLLEVAERALSAGGERRRLALAGLRATGEPSELSERVHRLLGSPPPESVRLNRPGMLLAAFVGVFGLLGLALTSEPDDAEFGEANPARVVLPNGTIVELLGVAEHYKDQEWWRPDGRPLENAPPEHMDAGGESWVAIDDDSMHRVFLVKASRLPGKVVHHVGVTPEGSEHNAGGATGASRTSAGLLVRPYLIVPAKAKTATVRFEFTSGIWETVLTLDPSGEPQDEPSPSARDVEFGGLTESDADGQSPGISSSVVLRVPREIDGRRIEYRAVLIDSEGRLHQPDSSRSDWHGDQAFGTNTMHFKVPPQDVREIRIEASPFPHWVEFRNVALHPGRRTAIEIESSTSASIRISEFADILATRVAEHLPFPSSALRERTRAEFVELVTKYAPQELSPEFVRAILDSLDAYLQAQFPHGPRADEPVVRDQDYLKLMPEIRNLQWTLFLALQRRPLDAGDQQRLAGQLEWMRRHIRSLPPRPEPSRPGETQANLRGAALAELRSKTNDPLFPIFKQPLTEEQFQQFQARQARYARQMEIRYVVSHLVWDYAQISLGNRPDQIPVPELTTFDEQPIGLQSSGLGSYGRHLSVMFRSAEAARGMPNGVIGNGSYVDLGGEQGPLTIRGFTDRDGDAPRLSENPTLDELDRWFAGQGWGELMFDPEGERVIGFRGTRLAPLEARRWTRVDRIPAEQIRARIEKEGSRFWKLPQPVSTDALGDRTYDAMAGVLAPDGRLFVLQIRKLEASIFWFHIREHDPLGLSANSSNE